MKLEFTAPEMIYMGVVLDALKARLAKDDQDVRALKKIRRKFGANQTQVTLGKKERELLNFIFGYRADALAHKDTESEEYKLVDSIRNKVCFEEPANGN